MCDVEHLLNSNEPWTVYRTMIDILGIDRDDPDAKEARMRMIEDPLVRGLVSELKAFPGEVLSSHKSAGQAYHRLSFLAEIGMDKDDPGIKEIIDRVYELIKYDGIPRLPSLIPERYGGSGEVKDAWALCDAPTTLYSLARIVSAEDDPVRSGSMKLLALAKDNGWPCVVSPELGGFRGPGKKGDPCPYATIIMLKLISAFDDYRDSIEAKNGVECILDLWENSRVKHPYIFYMGDDFRKLKAPFVWYDILNVCDILSRFEFARKDPRLLDMVGLIGSKRGEDGRFRPESEWKAWKGWDFGQKKGPSSWIEFLVCRIEKRMEGLI